MENGIRLAAVDLGSNSFRLEIGQHQTGYIEKCDYLKESVRLGNGLDEDRNLTPEALDRGWNCIARFGERLAAFSPDHVRAVATQTLREARNRDVFLKRAEQLLGFPIEVISGPEEARLIFQGVTRLLPLSDERRLVVDIGGRSTELVVGQHFTPKILASFRVGSVAWSMRYFPKGDFTKQAFEIAQIAAKAVLDEAVDSHHKNYWDKVYGSSGTVSAVADILFANGQLDDVGNERIVTRKGLDWLYQRLLKAKNAHHLSLEGLKEDRRAVIGGGVSVLRAIFELFDIHEMHVAQGALRQGVLYDLLNRENDQTDLRVHAVQVLSQKFHVDLAQAQRVNQTALALFSQLKTAHLFYFQNNRNHQFVNRFKNDLNQANQHLNSHQSYLEHQLSWAAQLHEIGLQIAHSAYHLHSAYILDHTDSFGFSLVELHYLSELLRLHRGKLKKLEINFDQFDFISQLICLRLAVLLCHARQMPDFKSIQIKANIQNQTFDLLITKDWVKNYPQSAYLLKEEVQIWSKTPWILNLCII